MYQRCESKLIEAVYIVLWANISTAKVLGCKGKNDKFKNKRHKKIGTHDLKA